MDEQQVLRVCAGGLPGNCSECRVDVQRHSCAFFPDVIATVQVGNEGAQQLIAKLNCIQFSSAFDALLRAQKIPDSPLVPGPSVKFLLRDLLLSNVKDEKGAVLFRGLAWFLTRSKIEDRSRIQPRHFSVSRALSTNPLVAHTAIYACVTAVLGGLLKDFGWASMCSGNLVNGVYTHSLSDGELSLCILTRRTVTLS